MITDKLSVGYFTSDYVLIGIKDAKRTRDLQIVLRMHSTPVNQKSEAEKLFEMLTNWTETLGLVRKLSFVLDPTTRLVTSQHAIIMGLVQNLNKGLGFEAKYTRDRLHKWTLEVNKTWTWEIVKSQTLVWKSKIWDPML
jgi:hypothetical protein